MSMECYLSDAYFGWMESDFKFLIKFFAEYGASEPTEVYQTFDVRKRRLRPAEGAGSTPRGNLKNGEIDHEEGAKTNSPNSRVRDGWDPLSVLIALLIAKHGAFGN